MSVVMYKFPFEKTETPLAFDGICIRAGDLLHRIARRTGHAQAANIRLRMFREDGTELHDHEVVVRNARVIVRRAPRFDKPEPLTRANASTPAQVSKKFEHRRGVPVTHARRFDVDADENSTGCQVRSAPVVAVQVPQDCADAVQVRQDARQDTRESIDIIVGWLTTSMRSLRL